VENQPKCGTGKPRLFNMLQIIEEVVKLKGIDS
jgi:hypothetical protein